jgi:hypothetical protein
MRELNFEEQAALEFDQAWFLKTHRGNPRHLITPTERMKHQVGDEFKVVYFPRLGKYLRILYEGGSPIKPLPRYKAVLIYRYTTHNRGYVNHHLRVFIPELKKCATIQS